MTESGRPSSGGKALCLFISQIPLLTSPFGLILEFLISGATVACFYFSKYRDTILGLVNIYKGMHVKTKRSLTN